MATGTAAMAGATMTMTTSSGGASPLRGLARGLRLLVDKRHSFRHRTLKGGRIAFHNGGSTLDCVVRNLSAIGARLEMASTLGIPDAFELVFVDGLPTRGCGVAWRSATALGVHFESRPGA